MNCTMEVTDEEVIEILKSLQSIVMYPKEYAAIDTAIEAINECARLRKVEEYISSIVHDKQSQDAAQVINRIEEIIWPHYLEAEE